MSGLLPGRYVAVVEGWGLRESGKSASVGVDVICVPLRRWMPEEQDWTTENIDMTPVVGTLWVLKASGERNQRAIDDLVAAIGWDGDPMSLVPENLGGKGTNYAGKQVEITIGMETYNGKEFPKVKYVSPIGGGRAMSKTSVESIMGKWAAAMVVPAPASTPATAAAPTEVLALDDDDPPF